MHEDLHGFCVDFCVKTFSGKKIQMLVVESTQTTKTPPKKIPFLKLTANASKNGRLEDDSFPFCMAYFQGL